MGGTFLGALDVRAMPDGVNWMLLGEFRYVARDGRVITVPAGFVTDFASIPRLLWTIAGAPATGKYRRAAVVHDWIYRTADVAMTRAQADRLFLEMMEADGCAWWRREVLYDGVVVGGWASFVPRVFSAPWPD